MTPRDVPPLVAVATSGGRDSIALLFATMRASRWLGLRVVALHVHHGLLPQADDWAADLEAQCEAWARQGWPVQFACARLSGAPGRGDSVEAWARRERYAALARMAGEHGASLVLLGHHRRDQAETVLLQALRGAGPAGLAAMPRMARRHGLSWARPWLAQPHEAIDDYVATHGLSGVVDPSNMDPRFARSRLRSSAMPALRAAFADAEQALAAVARRAHEARCVLDEIADEDLRRIAAGEELPLDAWYELSLARRANALRSWLARRLGRPAPDALVQRLLDEAAAGVTRRWPVDSTRWLRCWRGRLSVVPRPAAIEAAANSAGAATALAIARAPLWLPNCDRYAVDGWAGQLEVFEATREGIAPSALVQVLVGRRVGGERFQCRPGGLARSLKKQYQSLGVPAEDRSGPLLFAPSGDLLFAPGLGVDARAWSAEGSRQWGLRWLPSAADDA